MVLSGNGRKPEEGTVQTARYYGVLALLCLSGSVAFGLEFYDFGNPGPQEELLRQAIHRGRLDPEAEADRLELDNTHPEDSPDGTYDVGEGMQSLEADSQQEYWSRYQGPRQVLAWNAALTTAAWNHSDDMYTHGFIDHATQQSSHGYVTGDRPWDRAYAEGYPNHYVGENILANTSAGSKTGQDAHDSMFVNANQLHRPHRRNLLQMRWREIGVGYVSRTPNPDGWTDYWTVKLGSDWYWTGEADPWPAVRTAFVTGVAFSDDGDGAYEPGEELPDMHVTASVNGSPLKYGAVTADGGGYSLPLIDAAGNPVAAGSMVRIAFFDPATRQYSVCERTIATAEIYGEDEFDAGAIVQTERLNIGADVLASSLEPATPGDCDLDGDVDLDDFACLKQNFQSGMTWTEADFDLDGDVDLDDFATLKRNFGAAAVPEPATLALLSLGGVAVLRRR